MENNRLQLVSRISSSNLHSSHIIHYRLEALSNIDFTLLFWASLQFISMHYRVVPVTASTVNLHHYTIPCTTTNFNNEIKGLELGCTVALQPPFTYLKELQDDQRSVPNSRET